MCARHYMAGERELTHTRSLEDPAVADEDAEEFFSSEEMQAIREQYEERIALEQKRREELEWQVRMALATVRDAEAEAQRAANHMHRVYETLAGLLGERVEP